MSRMGFRSQVEGSLKIDLESAIDRRARRFMGDGAAYNYLAMQQAVADSGLEEKDIVNERTGLIMGSGGPSTKALVQAADIARTEPVKGPKKVGPFVVPKAMSSTCSAVLSTLFKIKGPSYSISSACATSAHCIGNAAELIQWGKQDVMFAGGGEELDWTLSVLFDAMGAMSYPFQRHARARQPRLRQEPRRLRHRGRRRRPRARRARSRQARAARRSMPSSPATARPPTATTWWRPRAKAPCAACARRSPPRKRPSTMSTRTAPRRRSATRSRSAPCARSSARRCRTINSTKSLTGHSLGAAGVHEAIYSLLQMQNGFIAESANIEELDPEVADAPIVRKRIDNAKLDAVMSNSFGFGGTNATLVFERYDA